MQRMFEHINAFADLLNRKGYDGNFHSPFGFYDKLKDNLTKHVFQCFEEKKKMEPINLATYTHWKDNDSPYVRCNFQIEFSMNEGFRIINMNISYGNAHGVLRHKDILIKNNAQIPQRMGANKMMLEQKMVKRI
jgi:hypothetical protein